MFKVSSNCGHSESSRAVCGIPGLAAASLAVLVAAAPSEASEAEAFVSINDGPAIAIDLAQGVSLGGGETWSGSHSVPGEWTVVISLNVEGDLFGQRVISGLLQTVNHGSAPRIFDLNLDLPVCESLHGSSVIAANTRMQLVSNANGGYIRVPGGEIGLSVKHDGAHAAQAYGGPFFVTASGASTATVFGNFSNGDAPMLISDHGMRLRYELSDGDTARLLLTQLSTSANDDQDVEECAPAEEPREGDVNGDGAVNVQDLIVLLSSWGSCAGCDADLDGNGFVDFRDAIVLFAAWD